MYLDVHVDVRTHLMLSIPIRNKRTGKRARSEYLNILKADLCLCYTYNKFLMDKFVELVPLRELKSFLDANAQERPVTIRTNTLKVRGAPMLSIGCNQRLLSWQLPGLKKKINSFFEPNKPWFLSFFFFWLLNIIENVNNYLFFSLYRTLVLKKKHG